MLFSFIGTLSDKTKHTFGRVATPPATGTMQSSPQATERHLWSLSTAWQSSRALNKSLMYSPQRGFLLALSVWTALLLCLSWVIITNLYSALASRSSRQDQCLSRRHPKGRQQVLKRFHSNKSCLTEINYKRGLSKIIHDSDNITQHMFRYWLVQLLNNRLKLMGIRSLNSGVMIPNVQIVPGECSLDGQSKEESLQLLTCCPEETKSKGVSGGSIHSLVESELWSLLVGGQKLLSPKASHWSKALSVDQGAYAWP